MERMPVYGWISKPVYGWINARFRMDKLHYKSKFYEWPLGVLVAKIFVIRFFPPKLFGKLIGKFGWKICWKNVLENLLENLLEMLVGNVGWKCWVEMLVEHLVGKCFGWKMLAGMLVGKMLVNGCENYWGKIVATNLPLRLSTTPYMYIPNREM